MKRPSSIVQPDESADFDYSLIPSFCEQVVQNNSGSQAHCDKHENESFHRCAWLFASQAIRCVRGGKRVFSIDACHLKHTAQYSGQLFNVCGFDGNGHAVTIEYALAPQEDVASYKWFIDLIKKLKIDNDEEFGTILDADGTVIFSDRQKGLAKAVKEECPRSTHLACCFHLLENTRKTDRQLDAKLFWWVQASFSSDEFERRMTKWEESSPAAVAYLRKQTQEGTIWITHQYIDCEIQTWGLRTSNLSEIVNARLLQTRHFPPLALMSATTRQLSLDIVNAKAFGEKLFNKGSTLTPYAQKLCEAANRTHMPLHAHPIDDNTCQVNSVRGGTRPDSHSTRTVTFPQPPHQRGHCTCHMPTLTGVYCDHAFRAER